MASLFSFNIHNRTISQGFPLTYGRGHPHNPMQIMPPHLDLGHQYLGLNKHARPAIHNGVLLRASLEKIEPQGKKPFFVFSQARENDECTLVYIDPMLPRGYKSRVDVDSLRAYTGIEGAGVTVIRFDRNTGAALLSCVNGATILAFLLDGRVERFEVSNHTLRLHPLSQKEMAQARVDQFDRSYAEQNDNVSAKHGILNAALRLAKATGDAGARDVLVDFLVDHQASMNDGLRSATRYALVYLNHRAADNFLDGFEAVNVLRINSKDGATKRAAQQAKKRARAERESQACHARRGKGGGDSNQSQGKKKAKGK